MKLKLLRILPFSAPRRLLNPKPGPGAVMHCLLLSAAATLMTQAQEPYRPQTPGALLAAETLKRQVLDRSFERFVEISGKEGNPIPNAWTIVARDSRSPSGLSEYVVRGRRVEVRGETNTFYPKVPPTGFFALPKVAVDSEKAFRIADREAGLAKVGFDSLNFRLRAREFSDDALWTVQLLDSDDEIVGHVDLSASSGKVLRTIWYYRDSEAEIMRIVDSAWPGVPKLPPEAAIPPSSLPAPIPPNTPPPGILPPAPLTPPEALRPTSPPPVVDPADPSRPEPEPLPVPEPGTLPEPAPLPVPSPNPGLNPRPKPQPVPVPEPTAPVPR
ncbi:MAG: hypothetical protein EOP86_15545 [Verrucomicrobiaceae bacterium]|nr:MAG: hypothetical protein EOP86_15545 [Verrucomicrobiaceae bacterium]